MRGRASAECQGIIVDIAATGPFDIVLPEIRALYDKLPPDEKSKLPHPADVDAFTITARRGDAELFVLSVADERADNVLRALRDALDLHPNPRLP